MNRSEVTQAHTNIEQQEKKDHIPQANVETEIEKEKNESWMFGRKSVLNDSYRPGIIPAEYRSNKISKPKKPAQLKIF